MGQSKPGTAILSRERKRIEPTDGATVQWRCGAHQNPGRDGVSPFAALLQ